MAPDGRKPMAIIPEKTLHELGWPALLQALAQHTRSSVGRTHTFELPFRNDREQALRHMGRVAEARRLSAQALEIPLADTPDARAHLQRAAREGVLEAPALLECARLMRTSSRVRRFLHARRELCPQLAEEAAMLTEFDPLAAEIERAIEPSGTLSDAASPMLAELRERTRGLHRSIKSRIDEMLHDLDLEEVLRDRYYSVRDERYVLPVKASHRGRLPGIVHNASQSGQTLFIEPDQLVDLGNQLTIAQSLVVEEERRVLRDLTEAVGRRSAELANDIDLLAEFDRLGACARLADRLDATEPALGGASEAFTLRGLRHPLLVLRDVHVVSNDVVLAEGKRGLIVSGPNAGGKTVTLTAVGLSALMARAGLPIPAGDGSRIPLYRAVYTAIGDEGDLSKDLSTFTAHLTALREIERGTIPGTLVCIDEMAADTDPREGAAIASAVLERLVERGAQVIITTHLDEVKAKGLTDERFAAASVGFDFERLAPTYRLAMNRVGASSAIEIARRVGLPGEVCDRARELLSGSGGALGRAVEALEQERDEVRRLQGALDSEREALARAKAEWERQGRALEQKQRELERGARRELVDELDRVREDVRRMLAKLQEQPSVRSAVDAQKELEKKAQEQAALAARAEAHAQAIASQEIEKTQEIRAGQRVRVASVGREGEVLEVSGEHATVAVGSLKTRVPVADLVPLTGRTKNVPTLRRSREERDRAVRESRAASLPSAQHRCDVRGLRSDDALSELRTALDQAFRDDQRELLVVHGHGTGALKSAVRDELSSSPYVDTFRRGESHEGGDGVTLVTLRSQ